MRQLTYALRNEKRLGAHVPWAQHSKARLIVWFSDDRRLAVLVLVVIVFLVGLIIGISRRHRDQRPSERDCGLNGGSCQHRPAGGNSGNSVAVVLSPARTLSVHWMCRHPQEAYMTRYTPMNVSNWLSFAATGNLATWLLQDQICIGGGALCHRRIPRQ